jgi:hypothetical protein
MRGKRRCFNIGGSYVDSADRAGLREDVVLRAAWGRLPADSLAQAHAELVGHSTGTCRTGWSQHGHIHNWLVTARAHTELVGHSTGTCRTGWSQHGHMQN